MGNASRLVKKIDIGQDFGFIFHFFDPAEGTKEDKEFDSKERYTFRTSFNLGNS